MPWRRRERPAPAPDVAAGPCRCRRRAAYLLLCAAQVATCDGRIGVPTTCRKQTQQTKPRRRTRASLRLPGPKVRSKQMRPATRAGGRSVAPKGPSRPATVIGNATDAARTFNAQQLLRAASGNRQLTCVVAGKPSNFTARRWSTRTGDRRSHHQQSPSSALPKGASGKVP